MLIFTNLAKNADSGHAVTDALSVKIAHVQLWVFMTDDHFPSPFLFCPVANIIGDINSIFIFLLWMNRELGLLHPN